MKAIGITSGIGSMLLGARQAGFEVAGNLEWRSYYHATDSRGRNTFTENFRGAPFPYLREEMTEGEFEAFSNPDLAIGHPECGRFSQLDGANRKKNPGRAMDPGDIPLFVDLVDKFQPRFFVMDDLPKSFAAFSMEKYVEKLPGYDLFPEWVSNWGYGNVQKRRNRMFMLGAHRDERWTFVPGERINPLKVRDVLEDLPTPRAGSNYPNHDPHDQTMDCFRALNLGGYRKKNTWAEVGEYFSKLSCGKILHYIDANGQLMCRIGFVKGHWDGPAHVLTGGNACIHALRCEPYTIRERARIQGFPDDFVFYGTTLNDQGQWHHDANMGMVKQTGKAMPIQFCRYVCEQIAAKIQGHSFSSSGKRVLPANEHVDNAKRWFCDTVGYADQESACGACWMASTCDIRVRRYGYTPIESVVPQRAPVRTVRSPVDPLAPRRGRGRPRKIHEEAPAPALMVAVDPLSLPPRRTARPDPPSRPRIEMELTSLVGGARR